MTFLSPLPSILPAIPTGPARGGPLGQVRALRLTATALMLTVAVAAAPSAQARPVPDSFADLVEQLSPTVVAVATEKTVPFMGRSPFQAPPGSPFEDFFRRYFGQPDRAPGEEAVEDRPRHERARVRHPFTQRSASGRAEGPFYRTSNPELR